jgi:uncharacterized protein YbjT (DUF2867 family)
MITILGASGKTGKAVAEALLQKGEKIRCVGRSLGHLQPLVDRGAEAFIGDQADARFLSSAFNKGTDAAYVLIPPKMDVDNVRDYYKTMGTTIVKAIKTSGLKKVVFLSSLGAERDEGTGPVLGLHDVEKMLDRLSDVDIVFLRPGYFYENTLMNIGLIKSKKVIANAMDPDAPILMVSTKDIGSKAAELLSDREFEGHSVVELFGQRMSYKMVTEIIGDKIGIPDLPYTEASDRDAIDGMVAMGLSKSMAESFVELAHGISAGLVTTTKLDPAKPNAPTKYCDFVDEVFYPMFRKAA